MKKSMSLIHSKSFTVKPQNFNDSTMKDNNNNINQENIDDECVVDNKINPFVNNILKELTFLQKIQVILKSLDKCLNL